MQREVPLAVNEIFHVFNRGTNKMKIFIDDSDYIRFQHLLYVCNQKESVQLRNLKKSKEKDDEIYETERGKPLVEILAYCLMPNHFHMVLRPAAEGGASVFLRKVCTGYSMYFNKINERSGTLFQGKFRSKHIANDLYFKQIFAYLHLNPAELTTPQWKERMPIPKQKIIQTLSSYPYSSYKDYFGGVRPEGQIITIDTASSWADEFTIPERLFDFYEAVQENRYVNKDQGPTLV